MKGTIKFETFKNGKLIRSHKMQNFETNLRRDVNGMANGFSVAPPLKYYVGGIILTGDNVGDSKEDWGAPVNVLSLGQVGDVTDRSDSKFIAGFTSKTDGTDSVEYVFTLGPNCGVGTIKSIGLIPYDKQDTTAIPSISIANVKLNNVNPNCCLVRTLSMDVPCWFSNGEAQIFNGNGAVLFSPLIPAPELDIVAAYPCDITGYYVQQDPDTYLFYLKKLGTTVMENIGAAGGTYNIDTENLTLGIAVGGGYTNLTIRNKNTGIVYQKMYQDNNIAGGYGCDALIELSKGVFLAHSSYIYAQPITRKTYTDNTDEELPAIYIAGDLGQYIYAISLDNTRKFISRYNNGSFANISVHPFALLTKHVLAGTYAKTQGETLVITYTISDS